MSEARSSKKTSSTGRSRSKDNNESTSNKDDKVVDNIALASILRKSADVVERGEFEAILYDALTEFRLYYKQKYPKVSSKSHKEKPSSKKKSAAPAAAAHPTVTETEVKTKNNQKEEYFSEDLSREFSAASVVTGITSVGTGSTATTRHNSGSIHESTPTSSTPKATVVASTPATATVSEASDAPFDEQPAQDPQRQQSLLSLLDQQEEIRRQVEAQVAEERERIRQEQTSNIERLVEEQLQQRLEVERKEQQARYEELLQQATKLTEPTIVHEEHDEPDAVLDSSTNIVADDDVHDGVDQMASGVEKGDNETLPADDRFDEGDTAVPVTPSPQYSGSAQPVASAPSFDYDVAAANTAAYTPAPSHGNYPGFQNESNHSEGSKPPNTSTTTTTTKFHLGTALFGGKIPFKAPKAPNPFKHAAFAATSKKNAHRARDDIAAAFNNDLSRQAESSGRRKAMGSEVGRAPGAAGDASPHHVSGTIIPNSTVNDDYDVSSNGPHPHDQTTAATTKQSFGGTNDFHGQQEVPANVDSTYNDDDDRDRDHYQHDRNHQFDHDDPHSHVESHSVGGAVPSPSTQHASASVGYENSSPSPPRPHPVASPSAAAFTEEEISAASVAAFSSAVDSTMEPSVGDSKPSFQQPVNKTSALIANGWIEQYRRSKMRYVWKEVLASLVEARRPGEETTLWIQREITDTLSGRKELEALHQIPMKALQEVKLNEMSTDNQFTLRLYNSSDEFVFRCAESPVDSMRWVQILLNYQKIARAMAIARGEMSNNKSSAGAPSPFEEEKKGPDVPKATPYGSAPASAPATASGGDDKHYTVRELRAVCHGAGINTAGMERSQLEAAAAEVRRRGTYFPPPGSSGPGNHAPAASYPYSATGYTTTPPPQQTHHQPYPRTQNHQQQPPPPYPQTNQHDRSESTASASSSQQSYHQQEQQNNVRMSVNELRAICHGAGINTAGMERRELEAAAEEVRKRGTYFDPPPGMHAPSTEEEKRAYEEHLRARQEEYRRQEEIRLAQIKKQQEEDARRRAEEEARRRLAEEEARRRAAAEEEARRKIAAEEEARRRQAEEEQRRRVAEEQRRMQQQQHEQQERYRQQQAAWAKQRQEDEARRRLAEQEAAEQRRRHEEAMRKQQQWAGPSSAGHAQHHQHPGQQQYYPQQHPQAQHGLHQHPPPPQYAQSQPRPQQHQQPPPQQGTYQQQHQQSAASAKYAKMANQSADVGQAVITRIKHDILIHWALQPPQLQMLRPVDILITTIHNVFPPALGVAGHDYFTKWTPIVPADVKGTNGLPDGEKLKKSVRKIRFFLHPDKIPRDLNDEQSFMIKMLWDITSDAWEEYQKQSEQLDWIHN